MNPLSALLQIFRPSERVALMAEMMAGKSGRNRGASYARRQSRRAAQREHAATCCLGGVDFLKTDTWRPTHRNMAFQG